MEQSVIADSALQTDSQNNLTTPCRVQKRLFAPLSNSSKRSLFREEKETKKDFENASDAESDLGHMSPLALTDNSSCDSSPGRQIISPLATPEKSPMIPLSSWDRLIPSFTKNGPVESISSFSLLKRITKSARFSPRRIFIPSPKSKSTQSSQDTKADSTLTSPDLMDKTIMPDEIVPETPGKESECNDQYSYVDETPQKGEYSEERLITPLGSVYKNIPIPRIHRRKSLGNLELKEYTSPEIKKYTLKRHLDDSLMHSITKYQKIDDLSVVPKARAALFQEPDKNINNKDQCFTLNPKSFYGTKSRSNKSTLVERKELKPIAKKRRSLPSYNSMSKRSLKRNRMGEINYGVGHGIKRPKLKRQISQTSAVKVDILNYGTNKASVLKENVNPKKEISNQKDLNLSEMDPSKKFFKFKPKLNAVVTLVDKIKLKVAVNQKNMDQINKKCKLDENLFDTGDLSVDEPGIESLEKNKVNNILKILEDDWGNDENDGMDTTQIVCTKIKSLSPKNSNIMLKNITMSPASELSNMASTMNIKDISITNNLNNVQADLVGQKYYPLFSKGYVTNICNDDNNSKKRKRTASWQLSSKYGNTENQYQIDAGQKMFGATQCTECGIVYYIGEPDDENAHLNYHNSFKNLKFQGWKSERIIYRDYYTSSRIILIEPKDSNAYWKKVTEILEIVDRDLGLSDIKLSFYRDKSVFMYIRDKTILGVLVAEYVKSAFQMIPELIELNCCTSESVPVKCGVNVVWTAMSHRRQGIATKLVDTLRANYYYGYIMSIDDIAFSTPTPSGKQFAEKYTKTPNFKVY